MSASGDVESCALRSCHSQLSVVFGKNWRVECNEHTQAYVTHFVFVLRRSNVSGRTVAVVHTKSWPSALAVFRAILSSCVLRDNGCQLANLNVHACSVACACLFHGKNVGSVCCRCRSWKRTKSRVGSERRRDRPPAATAPPRRPSKTLWLYTPVRLISNFAVVATDDSIVSLQERLKCTGTY